MYGVSGSGCRMFDMYSISVVDVMLSGECLVLKIVALVDVIEVSLYHTSFKGVCVQPLG